VDAEVLTAAPMLRGKQILTAHRGTTSPSAGFIDAAETDGDVELVHLVSASILPMGLITDDAFSAVMNEMTARLASEGPWDAVLLDLHGAGVSVSHDDMDGAILEAIRDVVGEETVIGVTLDMHANVSPLMIEQADIVNLYQTNPHLDTRQRAFQNAQITFRMARGEVNPRSHLIQLPLAINILKQGTAEEPLASILQQVAAAERAEGSLTVSLGLGYPYSDTPKMGTTVLVVDDGDADRAHTRAERLAKRIWQERADLQGTAPTADEAAESVAIGKRRVVLLDTGDNVGGGTPGDSTVLANALRNRGVSQVFVVLTDPQAAARAHDAGEGEPVSLTVGGRSGVDVGDPIELAGIVQTLSDGSFRQSGASHGGRPLQEVGPTAVIDCPDFGTVMITTLPFLPFSVEPYDALGIDLSRHRVIIAKGVIAPRAALSSLTDDFILVDTPGPSTADFQRFEFTRRRRPLYPFESEATLADAIGSTGRHRA
jgi:microcystin degradation protein MlrC